MLSAAHDEARKILKEQRDALERVTRPLLEREVLEADEFLRLLETPAAVDAPAPVEPTRVVG